MKSVGINTENIIPPQIDIEAEHLVGADSSNDLVGRSVKAVGENEQHLTEWRGGGITAAPVNQSVVIVAFGVLRETFVVEGLYRIDRIPASDDCIVTRLLVPVVCGKRELGRGCTLAQFNG